MSARRGDSLSTKEIIRRYQAGESSWRIAAELGCTAATVLNRLRGAGIAPKPMGSYGHLRGEQHGQWKGADSSYTAKHLQVRKRRGAPDHCERCGSRDPSKTYQWANLTGNYDDVADYAPMCVSCHKRYDLSRRPPRWKIVRHFSLNTHRSIYTATCRRCGEVFAWPYGANYPSLSERQIVLMAHVGTHQEVERGQMEQWQSSVDALAAAKREANGNG